VVRVYILIYSIYVDQWDWERIITREERNLEFLKYIVQEIYEVMIETEKEVCQIYKQIPGPFLPEQIHFIHSEELEERLLALLLENEKMLFARKLE
jgi:aspartate--ammonia ligase